MARVTALQLINRVMLYRRQPPVASYVSTNPEHAATLNAINMAKEDILSTRRHEFDLRHDGQLLTKASASSTDQVPTLLGLEGQPTAVLTFDPGVLAVEYINGEYVTRLIPIGDEDYSDTALRIATGLPASNLITLTFPFNLPKSFASTTCDLVYSEYLLPDTVREVVRANYEQNEINLEQLDATLRFDELFPSFSYETGPPRVISVGGFDTQTHLTTADPDPKLRAIVWPIPDDQYVISYSYYYRHPDLEDGDDELIGVPPEFVNDIVFQATSVMSMAWDANYSAAHFSDMAQSMASAKHRVYGGSASRRHTVKSWDSGRSLVGNQEGFPGRTIGGG